MRKNFTLIELMIVVAIIAIIAAIAIPGLLRARISSNETSAVGSLRSASTSQNQFQNATVKDRDLDGVGEYGYFIELSGQAAVPRGLASSPARPTFLTSVFGATSSNGAGLANKSGYNFVMYLPSDDGAATPIAETGVAIAPPGALPLAGALIEEVNNQETRWCCFGWPTSAGNSGNKAYFVNQSGEVISTNNQASPATVFFYTGNAVPQGTMPDDIFEVPGSNLDSPILTGTTTAGDGIVWNPTD